MAPKKVLVVGAGVVGLSTAVCIQQTLPDVAVTIIADKFTDETTSHVAAGIFRPGGMPSELKHTYRQWYKDSFDFFNKLVHSTEAVNAGTSQLSYYFFDTKLYNDELVDILYCGRPVTAKEMDSFPVKFPYGYFLTSLVIECRYFLPFLTKRFKSMGGTMKKRTVQSLEEFVDKYDLVINCTGVEAGSLVNDKEVYPVRGQIYRVKAPWLKHGVYGSFHGDCDTYIIPCRECVVVGGVRQQGRTDLSVDKVDSKAIWERCTAMVPSLKHAEVISEDVGLRPGRKAIRVEMETIRFPSGDLKVVHNYGHGGFGVMLSWGTAVHAAKLAHDALRTHRLSSQL
ncbi:PREDICTED: D-aspartate oxidase-like [Priapulus caudatus]|uniref:D-aspartate oxidase-like n=1 Tax=Priapulus caudatus TaxID=37621 RepID=A0ABM1F5Q6_PRICU|nr:PREDICTED: D-aspartate oxidase-like [Priapulus caudatus]XP_014679779.1 PREDICTED: D-aspartate oxidase-like [Priapulus caudatus]